MTKTTLQHILFWIIAIVLLTGDAYANAGLPMIVIAWPILWILLIPIIIIEWLSIKKEIKEISQKRFLYVISISNLVSTLVGIPFAWLCMVLIELSIPGGGGSFSHLGEFWQFFIGVTVQAAWLMPYEGHLYWMVPVAFLVLLVPFFIVSYWIESKITVELLEDTNIDPKHINNSVWKANIYSYIFLAVIALIYLASVFIK